MERKYLERYFDLFVHRRDVHARQTKKGTYYLVREPVTLRLIASHLEGQITCGWYALSLEDTVRWAAVDADSADGLSGLQTLRQRLGDLQMPSYLEASRRGGHLWVFLEPISARPVRLLLHQVIAEVGLEDLEVFPKQDHLGKLAVGSLMRGPLGVHRLSGVRYPFVDPVQLKRVGDTLAHQLDYMLGFETVTAAQVAKALAELFASPPKPSPQTFPERNGDIALIKERIDLYDFVSHYVRLNAKGQGLCPFHDDHRPSFSVNREEGYWYCFAGCGGGDVIHFYEKIRGIGRGQAIRELAQQCGVVLSGKGGFQP